MLKPSMVTLCRQCWNGKANGQSYQCTVNTSSPLHFSRCDDFKNKLDMNAKILLQEIIEDLEFRIKYFRNNGNQQAADQLEILKGYFQ